jgi:serine/threonine protein kinase
MPILGGGDLFDYLDNEKINDMRISDRFKSVAELMDQFVELHNRTGTEAHLHLDIKPENIMMKPMGIGVESPLLIDFGLSSKYSIRDGERFGEHREIYSGGKGTKEYMAPEAYGKGKSSNKSDIYSIGLVIVGMLGDINTLIDRVEGHSMRGSPLYNESNKGFRLRVKGGMMRNTLSKFLNRMVDAGPKKRPTALEASRFFRIMQRYSESYEVLEAKCTSIDDIIKVKGVTVDAYQKASNKLKLEMLRMELFKGNGRSTGLQELYEDVDFNAMKDDMEKVKDFFDYKGNDLFTGDLGGGIK